MTTTLDVRSPKKNQNDDRSAEAAAAAELVRPAKEQGLALTGPDGLLKLFTRYMRWFDGNPARLWPHPSAALAERCVDAIGGVDRVVGHALAAYDEGDFRWAATFLDHAVFVDETYEAVGALYADTLEQLDYGSENGTWRNFFLSVATELRGGNFGTPTVTNAPAILAQLTPEHVFDATAITVDGPNAWDLDLAFDLTVSDLGRRFHVTLRNGVLVYVERERDAGAGLHPTLAKGRLIRLAGGDLDSDGLDVVEDLAVPKQMFSVLSPGDPALEIVLP